MTSTHYEGSFACDEIFANNRLQMPVGITPALAPGSGSLFFNQDNKTLVGVGQDWRELQISRERIINVAKSGGDFTTLEDAIIQANSLNPAQNNSVIIFVAPGTYEENNPLTISSWISVVGESPGVSINSLNTGSPTLIMSSNSSITRLNLARIATSDRSISLTGVIDVFIRECEIRSSIISTSSTFIIDNCIFASILLLTDSTVRARNTSFSREIDMSGTSSLNGSDLFFQNALTAVNARDTSICVISASRFINATFNGLNNSTSYISSSVFSSRATAISLINTSSLTITGCSIINTGIIPIINVINTAKIRGSGNSFNYNNLNQNMLEANFNLSFTSLDQLGLSNNSLGTMSHGSIEFPSASHFGTGGPNIDKMVIFQVSGATTTAIPALFRAFDNLTIIPIYPDGNINSQFVVGMTGIGQRFAALGINAGSGLNLLSTQHILEYLGPGGVWLPLPHMLVGSDGVPRGDSLDMTGIVTLRFGINIPINTFGTSTGSFIRFRRTVANAQNPGALNIRVISSCTTMNVFGFMEHFGDSQPKRKLRSAFNPKASAVTPSAGTGSIFFTKTLGITVPNISFPSGTTNPRITILLEPPFDMDTSRNIEFVIKTVGTTAGTGVQTALFNLVYHVVSSQVYFSVAAAPADNITTVIVPFTITSVIGLGIVKTNIVNITVPSLLADSPLNTDNKLTVSIVRRSQPSNDYTGNIVLLSITPNYIAWSTGGSPST